MKESKFEISKVYAPSGGKNIGFRKSEFVPKTQFLSLQINKSVDLNIRNSKVFSSNNI